MPYRVNAPTIVHETIDDETIIINFDTGTYYSCRGVANHVWTLLDAGHGRQDIVTLIRQAYTGDAQVITDALDDFITNLVAEEILVESQAAEPAAAKPVVDTGATKPFVAPVLEQFSDMQELLLLDPIHDVGDLGWPQRKSE